jgi:hypothetical protein
VIVLGCGIWYLSASRDIPFGDAEAPKTARPVPERLQGAFEPGEAKEEALAELLPRREVSLVDLERQAAAKVDLAEKRPSAPPETPLARTKPDEIPLPLQPQADAPPRDKARDAFATLPIGKAREVDFQIDESTRNRLTLREQADQLRDWLLYTVVREAGLDPDTMSRVLFDVPAVRHGYLRPTANFEYGLTRSCFIGDGKVVALIPRCDEKTWKDHLAQVADEFRKTLGKIPETFHVFEYDLDVKGLSGSLTRRDDVAGEKLFTKDYGYHEARVKKLQDFRDFMSKVQDVTSAHLDGGVLVLGGRKMLARDYGGKRGYQVADVAAVWQAQDKIRVAKEKFDREYRKAHDDLQAVWQGKLTRLNSSYQLDRIDERTYKAEVQTLKAGYKAAADALDEEWTEKFIKLRLVDGTGFSLDPTYDYDGLAKWFREESGPSLNKLAEKKDAPITRRDVAKAQSTLEDKTARYREVELLRLLEKLKKSSDPAAGFLGELLDASLSEFKFQQARYDGDLQGTEVGMILFYTDLLAKMWGGLDYGAPKQAIPNFPTAPDGGIAPFYRQETLEHSYIRLWFGPEDHGFQVVDARKGMLFARRSTRIFAASSNPLRPGEEVPAGHQAERLMGWWNDHYEEVAHYEPQYERLNEYMKWSLIVSWLYGDGNHSKLHFLEAVEVDRKAWFSDWVKKCPELRFDDWKRVGLHPRGHYKGTKTETLPILRSRSFSNYGEPIAAWTMSGGVSGGRPSKLKTHPVLPERIPKTAELTLRGVKGVEGLGGKPHKLETVRGLKHTFDRPAPARATMRIEAKPDLPLRAADVQLKPTTLERSIDSKPAKLTVETRAGDATLGSLEVSARGNGFRVEHRARDVDLGHSLARDLSASGKDPAHFLPGDARVESVIRVGERVLVRLRGSEKMLEITPEAKASSTVAEGFEARVAADKTTKAKTYSLKGVEAEAVLRDLIAGEYLRIELEPLTDKRPGIPVLARGPPKLPEGTRRVTIHHGGEKIDGHLEPNGRAVIVRVRDLPAALRESPEALARSLQKTDPPSLVRTLADPKAKLELGSKSPLPSSRDPLTRALERGDKRAAARRLAEMSEPERVAWKKADVVARLDAINRFVEQGRNAEALHEIALARRLHPSDPQLLLLEGLARVGLGRGDAGALSAAAGGGAKNPRPFLDAVNRLLKRSPSGPQRQAARATAGDALSRNMKIRNKTAATSEGIDGARGRELHAHFPSEPALEPAKPGDVPGDAMLFLDSSSGLHNLDWSPASRPATLQQAVEGGAELYVVKNPDPAWQAAPDRATAGTRAKPSEKAQTFDRAFPPSPYVPSSQPTTQRSVWPPDDDEEVVIVLEEEQDKDATKGVQGVKVKKPRAVYVLRKKVKK